MYKKLLYVAICLTISVCTVSCLDKGDPVAPPVKEDFFNFSMEQEVRVGINYGFQNNYVVLFELYGEDPIEETPEGSFVKKEIEPLYRAATNGKGEFSGRIKLPSTLSTVWLYTDYAGAVQSVNLNIDNQSIGFDQPNYIANLRKQKNSRSVTPTNNHTYPDGWLILGDWGVNGTPDYSLPEPQLPPQSTLYTIKKLFLDHSKQTFKERYPQFFGSDVSSDVRIIKPTKVRLVFINSTASFKNTVGYFTYPTNDPPTSIDKISHILAFPAVTPVEKFDGKGALTPGEQVQLKYWDGTQFQEEFPAGVSIGWFLEPNAFNPQSNIVPVGYAPCRYSLSQFNGDGEQRTVSLRDQNTDRIVAIAFEDKTDSRFNDAVFYLGVEEEGAIDPTTPVLPDVDAPPSDEENSTTRFGTLAFEDLWPNRGDYDMNDVMIDYSCKLYKRVNSNNVYKIEDTFTPRKSGGSLVSGFGYQLTGVDPSMIKKVTINTPGTPSTYMNGAMLEPGQTYPTILLFDNGASVRGKQVKVTIELNDLPESSVAPPYNPFIFVESDKGREKEVHLVLYRPTDKADPSLFGTGKDGSIPKKDIYYVTSMRETQYPFALNIAGVKDFPIPQEGVAIDETYPRFRSWVESGGVNDKDWYK